VSRCRSCFAEIVWVKTQSGKSMPLDPLATAEGNVTVDERGVARVRVGRDREVELERGASLYTSHFVTCPEAERWRR